MKKISGTIQKIVKEVEVGAKYIADDGKEFTNELDCQQYEKLSMQQKKRDAVESKIIRGESVYLNGIEDGVYLVKYNSASELVDDLETLRSCRFTSAYLDDNTNFEKDALKHVYPKIFVVYEHENEGDYPSTDYNFYDLVSYKERIQEDLQGLMEAEKKVNESND